VRSGAAIHQRGSTGLGKAQAPFGGRAGAQASGCSRWLETNPINFSNQMGSTFGRH
jgi:hypothetical protein